ncbi:helix-turn-helix transcriptional regulator [Alicyclobacillus tolerans]|uniref:helix-turn-helix domain-containing protein n=1 Tax=Alicyclobacillus tolerans TaxID=90970 RepID=UPI001F4879A5|nr:helix-turn-helix transcriptional regulator [Alicyclobacillus tolerans]MCF8567731.1 helix-turn-helix transcriptional regulator [Alicyclobacillus tolerans]
MTNPIKRFLSERRMSAQQAAIVTGMNVETFRNYLNGGPASINWRAADKFARLGLDPGKLMIDYAEWREDEARRLQETSRK